MDIDFRWLRDADGYMTLHEGVPWKEPQRAKASRELVRKGGALVPIEPLKLNGNLFRQFAGLHGKPASAIEEFAGFFGPLTERGNDGQVGDRLDKWREHIKLIRSAVLLAEENLDEARARLTGVGRVALAGSLRAPIAGGRPVLSIAPVDLLNAMWLQLLQFLSFDVAVVICQRCGTWFETGPKAGRRKGSKFCSPQCKIDHHNQRKLKGDRS